MAANKSSPPKKHKPEVSGRTTSTNKTSSSSSSSSSTKRAPGTTKTPSSPTKSKPSSSRAIVKVDKPVKVSVPPTSSVKQKKAVAKPPTKKEQKYEDQDETKRRRGFICLGIVCCLLILLILGLVLGLVVFKDDDEAKNINSGSSGPGGSPSSSSNANGSGSGPNTPANNPQPSFPNNFPTLSPIQGTPPAEGPTPSAPRPPTPSPTRAPTTPRPVPAPVLAPTSLLQPTPSQLIILPFADTYVQRDGFDQSRFASYGDDTTFLVQNGPVAVNEIPDAVGLLGFKIGSIPKSFSRVTLQLYHQPRSRNRGAATLTVRLLPSTPLAIESLHGGLFNPEDDEGTFGPTFSVAPSDTIVQVDLTSLVRNAANDDQLFLMLENRGAEQFEGGEGDRFYSRETDDPPQLIVSF